MIVARRWAAALVAVAACASGLAAQDKGKGAKPDSTTCAMNFEKPAELKDAQNNLVIAQMGKGDAQKKSLAKVVEKLSRRADYYAPNSVSQAFLLGQALVLWSNLPGEPASARRGDIGFLGDKDQQINLLKTADSLFTVVEKALPLCAEQTSIYRKSAWARYINRVGPFINADKMDSAQAVLDESMVIYRESPYTSYFEGQIAYRKDDYAKATASFEKAAALGAKELASDSNPNLQAITEYSAFFGPYSGARAAATLTGADQAAGFKHAATLFTSYLKNFHCGAYAEPAATGLFEALRNASDTAGLRTAFETMAKEQRPCSDIWWYNAARDASEAEMNDLAVQLSDKAVNYSPWSAALGNAGGAYWKAKAWVKLEPVAMRLTQVAPNMPDNWQMLALTYQGLNEAATTPALKKAYSDSLVNAYNTGEKISVKVRVATFTADGGKRTIGGTLELVDNSPTAPAPKPKPKAKPGQAKPAPAPPPPPAPAKLKPRDVTLKIEFLDRAGKVLTVKDSTGTAVPAVTQTFTVKPDEKTDFKFTVQDSKIVGYRYAPIP
jgi:hypothetical protein